MIEHEHQQKCLRINCSTCKNSNRMTKFEGDGKAKQACEGCKRTEKQTLLPLKIKSKKKKETKKTQKKAGNLTASTKTETQSKIHNKANAGG